uniref:Uncharacterized protein n=1 Tax=Tanacetum cinerariifolium TaxID=118510 RepID=A0A6L2JFN9_TANCI|nr:hypothetical protein [Tanacetum cinerariifolium]
METKDTLSSCFYSEEQQMQQIQDKAKKSCMEKGFAITALKNEIRKLTGNSVNTKFAKSSILEKPVLQPHRNQSVVRQTTAFKSERPRISKPRFTSQVDVNNDLPKPVTTHYFPKGKEFACAKPHHMIAPDSSSNSSNDMVHYHYLEEAKKQIQEIGRNSKTSKCVFNANHDASIMKFLNEVNSRAKVSSNKTTNRNKLVEQISVAKKLERQIPKRHRNHGFKKFYSDKQAMTYDHNSSKLKINDHSNESSSSKLVPKVVSLADKIATSQQELELLFSPMYEEYFNARNQTDMSSASSAVTYTSVYTDSEPGRVFWGADEELSDGEDEHILPGEEQPLPPVVSPTAESPGYVAESDPEEDPKEYEEDEIEDGPVGYPIDGGDDGDDDDIDSSGYDANNEDEDEEDEEEEEEEYLAPADSATTSISLPPEAEVERLLAMPTPPPSPLTSLSPPSTEERQARYIAPATLPSPPLPSSSYLPPPVDRMDGIPESEQPPCKRLCLFTLVFRYEVGESFTRGRGADYGFANTVEVEMRHRGIGEVGYEIRDTWIDPTEAIPEMKPTTLEKVNTRVTELDELHEHNSQDLYALLEDAKDGLSQTEHHELQTLREQAELLALRGQPMRAGQPGGDVRVPNHQDAPRDADSHI